MDELEGQMTMKHFYVLVSLTYELLVIGGSDRPDARDRSLAQKYYFSNLGFKFSIGMFRYRTGWSKADLVIIFRVPMWTSTSDSDFSKPLFLH